MKFIHHKGNSKVFFDSIQPVQLVVLNRKHQLEKALASEPSTGEERHHLLFHHVLT